MNKWGREFYDNLDLAIKRYVELLGLSKEIHLIKHTKSKFYVVCWEK